MKGKYDFHIHTALSPCGDEFMTPNNIINMCKLNAIDMIAITDHNACGNCKAIMELGEEQDILVIPGMEIECIEEFHNIALFPDLKSARVIEKFLKQNSLPIKNKPHIFGSQYLLDREDKIIGEEELLLVTAIQVDVTTIYKKVNEVGGIIYPAHIDRNAYSILSNLGDIPDELDIQLVEVAQSNAIESYSRRYPRLNILSSSDAHYLQQLCEERKEIEIEKMNIQGIFKKLKNNSKFKIY